MIPFLLAWTLGACLALVVAQRKDILIDGWPDVAFLFALWPFVMIAEAGQAFIDWRNAR